MNVFVNVRFAAVLTATALLLPGGPASGQAVDTVRAGSASLDGAVLAPGSWVLENYQQTNGVDELMGSTRQSVRRGEAGGVPVWIVETVHVFEDTSRSSIVVRADDFSLVHHSVRAAHDSASVAAGPGYLAGWVVLPDEPLRLLDRALAHPVFPVEGQIPWLFPLLPLRPGYAAAIPHFNQWRGEESWAEIRVLGEETIEVNGRSCDCWKVDGGELFPGYGVTYWIDRETRRIVRGVASGQGDGPVYRSETAP